MGTDWTNFLGQAGILFFKSETIEKFREQRVSSVGSFQCYKDQHRIKFKFQSVNIGNTSGLISLKQTIKKQKRKEKLLSHFNFNFSSGL